MDIYNFEAFAARVANLTPDECAALVAAHRPLPDTDAVRQWHGDLRLDIEFGLRESKNIDRAYTVAEPFRGTPAEGPILDIALVLAYPPGDPSITEISVAGWRAVILDARMDSLWPSDRDRPAPSTLTPAS